MQQDFQDPEQQWRAVTSCDPAADGTFFYAVKTTGIVCRPSCKARTPKRENVLFYNAVDQAIEDGYTPCKRCRPDKKPGNEKQKQLVLKACRYIEKAEQEPTLKDLADDAGLSPAYFNKLFKSIIGITPKQYAIANRSQKAATLLRESETVTAAIYDAGYSTSSRFYEKSTSRHGMTAGSLRNGARGIEIRYAYGETSLGKIIVAATDMGICSVLIGDNRKKLLEDIKSFFPHAKINQAEQGSDFMEWVNQTIAYIDDTSREFNLPLDIAGTAFQERVWQALRKIPRGKTISYSELSENIENPKAIRAVASACAANRIAVIIPCHRVLRSDGSLSGYRWGKKRKEKLIKEEKSDH